MGPELRPFAVREAEACRLTGLKRSKLLELAYEGALPSYKVGRNRLFSVAELERWVEAQAEARRGGGDSDDNIVR